MAAVGHVRRLALDDDALYLYIWLGQREGTHVSCLWDAACEHRWVYRDERAQAQSGHNRAASMRRGNSRPPRLPTHRRKNRPVVRGRAAG
jgi:hypothetical protein